MDTGSILVGIIMICVSLLPFILISKSRKKNRKQFIDILKSNEICNDIKISASDQTVQFMIGVDNVKHHLFFIRKDKVSNDLTFKNINEIKRCELRKTLTSNQTDSTENRITRVTLQLFDTVNEQKELLFYDYNNGHNLNGELQIAQKWEEIINQLIQK